jgi:tetratricopeptide (TPR) repeat protein
VNQEAPQQSSISTTSPQLSSISSFSQPFPSNTGSDFIKEDFEKGLNELKNGSARKAKEIFTTVVERLDKLGVDNYRNLYFRAKSNLGISTYLCGDDLDFATICLEEAFPYSDGSIKGRTNKALVCSLLGNDEQALVILNGILAETPGHFDASAQKADCLGRLGKKAEALLVAAERS